MKKISRSNFLKGAAILETDAAMTAKPQRGYPGRAPRKRCN